MKKTPNILITINDLILRLNLLIYLEKHGYQFNLSESGHELLYNLKTANQVNGHIDIIVHGICRDESEFMEFYHNFCELQLDTPVISIVTQQKNQLIKKKVSKDNILIISDEMAVEKIIRGIQQIVNNTNNQYRPSHGDKIGR